MTEQDRLKAIQFFENKLKSESEDNKFYELALEALRKHSVLMNITDKLVYKREHSKNAGKIKNRFWINVKNNLVIRHETYRLINDKEKQNIILKSHSYLLKQIINKIL